MHLGCSYTRQLSFQIMLLYTFVRVIRLTSLPHESCQMACCLHPQKNNPLRAVNSVTEQNNPFRTSYAVPRHNFTTKLIRFCDNLPPETVCDMVAMNGQPQLIPGVVRKAAVSLHPKPSPCNVKAIPKPYSQHGIIPGSIRPVASNVCSGKAPVAIVPAPSTPCTTTGADQLTRYGLLVSSYFIW